MYYYFITYVGTKTKIVLKLYKFISYIPAILLFQKGFSWLIYSAFIKLILLNTKCSRESTRMLLLLAIK